MAGGRKKLIRRSEDWAYNATEDELMEAQRLARKIVSTVGESSGEIVLHHNRGEVLSITLREVVKKTE